MTKQLSNHVQNIVLRSIETSMNNAFVSATAKWQHSNDEFVEHVTDTVGLAVAKYDTGVIKLDIPTVDIEFTDEGMTADISVGVHIEGEDPVSVRLQF